jgi:XisI protein
MFFYTFEVKSFLTESIIYALSHCKMDKIEHYRQLLTGILEKYAAAQKGNATPYSLTTQLVFDRERDQYQVLGMGWHGEKQSFLVLFHFAIKDGKIWLCRNVGDYDIVADLEARGVPKEDIVLAFQPPAMRPFTGYAVA